MMLHFKAEVNSAGNVYIYERRQGLWWCVALNQISFIPARFRPH